MTFHDISAKMLKSSYKRYLLYFWCNVFTVALFYTFASLFTNNEFMNPSIVNSMISSNVYAPSGLTAIFMVLFLNYSYGVFLKSRKSEYGVLMTLGMDDTEVIKNIIMESVLIHLISLACGLLVGTGLSFLFYAVIHFCIGVSQISLKLNLKSYGVVVVFYCAVTVVTVIFQIFRFTGMQIIDLLKERVKGEKRSKGHWTGIIIGVIFMAASVAVMLKEYTNGSDYMWYVSILLMALGLIFLFSNMEAVLTFCKRKWPKWFEKRCLEKAFIMRHFKSCKMVTFVVIWLIAFSVLFEGFSAVTHPAMMKNAITYTPYDMVYSQIFGMNRIENSDVCQFLKEQNVTVSQEKEIPYLRGHAFNLLAVSDVNRVLGCNYKVGEKEYITLYQIDLEDGYAHDLNVPDKINIAMKDRDLSLNCIGREIRIFFNDNPATADYTLIISDNDYAAINEEHNFAPGIIKMFNFADWKSSKAGVERLQQHMTALNGIKESELKYYKLSSKIETYNTAKQSSQILLFMMTFVIVLFCISADIIIHFKVKSEMTDEQRMFQGLFRIGITDKEKFRIVYNKNKCYYLIPILIGCITGIFYDFSLTSKIGYGLTSIKYSLSISILLVIIQFIFAKYYSKRESITLNT